MQGGRLDVEELHAIRQAGQTRPVATVEKREKKENIIIMVMIITTKTKPNQTKTIACAEEI